MRSTFVWGLAAAFALTASPAAAQGSETAERQVAYDHAMVLKCQALIAQERGGAKYSGYVDARKLHDYGMCIQVYTNRAPTDYAAYRQSGGRKTLAQIYAGTRPAPKPSLFVNLPNTKPQPAPDSQDTSTSDCDESRVIRQTRSLDGGYLYQQVCHWVTSDDIIQVRVSDGRRREVTPGNSLAVIRNGPWRGYLLVEKHKYTSGPNMHAYDATYVVRPDGKETLEVPGGRDGNDGAVKAWLLANGWTAN